MKRSVLDGLRRWRVRFSSLSLGFLLAAAPVHAADAPAPLKVAFVYVGPIGDAGWTYAHDRGRLALEQALPGQVSTSFVESVPEGADAERVIRQLAADGNQLIFTTSFGYMDATLKVARLFPKTRFMHATGFKTAANVGVYESRAYESSFLLGVLAGGATKTNTLGFVASFPIPEVIRNINAFTLGAQTVNPKIKTKVIWVNTWYDPGKERQAAETLIAQGADVLSQNTDSPAVLQTAEHKGVLACGRNSDMSRFAPNAQLAAGIVNWGPFYAQTAKAVRDATWTSGATQWGVAEDMVDVVAIKPGLPVATLQAFDAHKKALADGSHHVFDGPLLAQDGSQKLAPGASLDAAQLRGMNWFVAGVDSPLPH